ncbi:MAG: hypothetical protein H6739_39275 [Alphaproteobacteria bacterium]|nr:hypothetical protein [Alphaproteobacteria bacterium]
MRHLSDRAADRLTLAVILGVGLSHLCFILLDQRLPRDLGLYYKELPALFEALQAGRLPMEAMTRPGGWLNLLTAVTLFVAGRSGEVFRLLDLGWLLLLLGATAGVARRVAGPRAALLATAMTASAPMVYVSARMAWIHVPEAALSLGLLYLMLQPPTRMGAAAMTLCGALVISLRPSGVMWLAPLVAFIVAQSFLRQRPLRGVFPMLLAWGLSLLVPLSQLRPYLQAKLDARPRYAALLPGLGDQLLSGFGVWVLPLIALGVVGLLSRDRARLGGPLAAVLGAWIALPLLAWAVSQAGVDNFTAMVPAAALLAGVGLAARFPWMTVPILLVLASLHAWPWVPPEVLERARGLRRIPGMPQVMSQPHVLNYRRAFTGDEARVQLALIDAACATRMCFVVVDGGLFFPHAEDPGRLELFLAGYDHVLLHNPRREPPRRLPPDAIARWTCEARPERPELPAPGGGPMEQHTRGLTPVWSGWLDWCRLDWYVPDGVLEDPDALPPPIPPQRRLEVQHPLIPSG